ncbi:MAG TPA: hypothetical protein VGK19_21330 [Capsulimonadaceae bacterium]|jgi:hypothetical protein
MYRILSSPKARVGVVVGTFAALPYVHLQLEARRRYWPDVPVIVHDDASPQQDNLLALCREYGVDFDASPYRQAATVGDMAALVAGFDWARGHDLDYVVKLSRRFVIMRPWVDTFRELAFNTQFATYSGACSDFGFGFRTECTAYHVRTWFAAGAVETLRGYVARNESAFVEGLVHELARDVHRSACDVTRRLERWSPREGDHARDADGYGYWPLLGTGRSIYNPGILWHDYATADSYWGVAQAFGLTEYTREDFADPNAGAGAMP